MEKVSEIQFFVGSFYSLSLPPSLPPISSLPPLDRWS
jgi:hypothetical protein